VRIPAEQLKLWERLPLVERIIQALRLTGTPATAGDLAWLLKVRLDDVWEALQGLRDQGEVQEVGGGFWRAK
jgi:hypothetical protein